MKRIDADIDRRVRRASLRNVTRKRRRERAVLRLLEGLAADQSGPGYDLGALASSLIAYSAVQRAGRLAAASRGAGPGAIALEKLHRRVIALAKEISGLQTDGHLAFRRQPGAPSLTAMMKTLSEWNTHVAAAHRELVARGPEPTRKGSDTKVHAERVAEHLAIIYRDVTGLEPAIINRPGKPAHGPFIDFVKAAFSALGIRGSAAVYARKAVERLPKGSRPMA